MQHISYILGLKFTPQEKKKNPNIIYIKKQTQPYSCSTDKGKLSCSPVVAELKCFAWAMKHLWAKQG